MRLPDRTVLYLISVLVLLLFFSLSDFLFDNRQSGSPLHDESGKQLHLIDLLSEKEKEIAAQNPGTRVTVGIKLNVNRSSAIELSNLPGISMEVAENIIIYRRKHGNIEAFEELLNVKGIKEKRLKKIRPFIEL